MSPGLFTLPIAPSAVRGWRFWREAGRSFASPAAAGGHVGHVVAIGETRFAPSRNSPLLAPSPGRCSLNCHPLGAATVGLLGWTRFHVGHGGSRPRLAYTTLPSHAFYAASRKHRRLAAAASSRNPYLYWECEENRHKGVHFAQQRVNGSGVVGYRSGQTQVLPAGRYAASRDARSAPSLRPRLHESDHGDSAPRLVSRARNSGDRHSALWSFVFSCF